MRLTDKIAVITGAGSGIGRATALLFAREGARVVIADIDNHGGIDTENLIKESGGKAIFVHTDVSVAADVAKLVSIAIDRFGKIDILYNNAGIFMKNTPVEQVEESLWERIFAVNVQGIFHGVKYVVPEMRKSGGGVIINTASMTAVRPLKNMCAYAASKGAVITLTKALALELAPYKIRVNCINPAITETPIISVLSEEQKKATVSTIPLGRMAKPEDIAHAALYLASDESAMLTGTSLNVDGGRGI